MEGNQPEVKTDSLIPQEKTPMVIIRSIKLDSLINDRGDTMEHTNISLVINIQNPAEADEDGPA